MAPQVAGKYEFESGDNFEAYLKATGLSPEHVGTIFLEQIQLEKTVLVDLLLIFGRPIDRSIDWLTDCLIDWLTDWWPCLNLHFLLVEIGKELKPTIELSQNGEEWTMDIKTEVMNKSINFKVGQEFSETTPSGKVVKSTIRKDGDKLVQTQTFENGFNPSIDLEFSEKGLKMTYTWPGGKCVRNYKRV